MKRNFWNFCEIFQNILDFHKNPKKFKTKTKDLYKN